MRASRDLRWSELKVGATVMVALALLAAGILSLGGTEFFSPTYNLYVYMDNSFGLKAGSIVRLAGLEVGNVSDVSLSTRPNEKKVVVTMDIRKDFRDRIRADSTVTIRTMGLLGDKYVDLSVGSPEQPVIPPGSVLKDVKETQVTSVLAGASSGLEGLNVVLRQLRGILGEVTEGEGTVGHMLKDPTLYRQLNESAASLQSVAEDLKRGKGTAGKLIQDRELYNNLVEVSAKTNQLVDKLNRGALARLSEDKDFYENLSDVSANLKDVSAGAKTLVDELKGGNFAKMSNDRELYAKIERVSDRLDRVTAKLEGGQGSAGKLLADEKLYSNMNKFFEDADALVLDIKENPKKYINISIF